MADIEFLDEDADDAADLEELAPGPRHRYPRWAFGAAVAVLVVGVAAATILKGGNTPVPQPRTSAQPVAVPSRSAVAAVPDDLGPPIAIPPSNDPVLAVAVVGKRTWVLRQREIQLAAPGRAGSAAVEASTEGFRTAQLAVDPQADLVWVVFGSDFGSTIGVLRAGSLATVGSITFAGAFQGVAALDAHLYLAVADRIVELAPSGSRRTVARPRARVTLGELVADPSRHRLLAVSLPALDVRDSRLFAVDLRTHAVVARTPHVVGATVSLSGEGTIWLGGRDDGDGVFMSLDPRTLAPAVRSPLDPILAPRAIVVSGGSGVVWVRDGTGSVLRCIDASGNQLQTWNVDGPVGSSAGYAVIARGTGVRTLVLAGCTG